MWTLNIQGPNGGANLATAEAFAGFQVGWSIEGPGSIEFDLNEAHLSDIWLPGIHRLILEGDHGWAGYNTRLVQQGRVDEQSQKAGGIGLQSILDWRGVRHATVLNDSSDVLVAWLLEEAQTQFNGDMNFNMGTVTGSFPDRLRSYCFGVVISDGIRELANLDRGFDWEIDENGDLNLWGGGRGVDTGLTLDGTTISLFEKELDTSELLTTVSAIGEPSDPFGPRHDMVRNIHMADLYGRHEIFIDVATNEKEGLTGEELQQELRDAARAELTIGGGAILRVRAGWWSHKAPWALGDVWLNDRATVLLPSYFSGDQDMRCTDITVTVDPMPEHDGGDPVYWVEQNFDALVGDITDGDPDEGS